MMKKNSIKKVLSLTAALLLGSVLAFAQNAPQAQQFNFPKPDVMFNIWPDGAPTDNGLTGEEQDFGNHVANVTKPTLAVFLPAKPNGLAILVCPGGGYSSV